MKRIRYKDHKGNLQIWHTATPYIRQAWEIFLTENNIKGIPNYAEFCFFLAVIIEVARISREDGKADIVL